MGFVLDGLDSEAYDRNYTDRDLIRRIAAYFRPYARQMALIAAAITLNSAAGSGGPLPLRHSAARGGVRLRCAAGRTAAGRPRQPPGRAGRAPTGPGGGDTKWPRRQCRRASPAQSPQSGTGNQSRKNKPGSYTKFLFL